ncbi:type VI secretion system baseplate subunit TssG [Methylobacterium aerolatum]|uniref:Type VI secretion system protein ImpH n=1 Tax=Methylobacterium aerolatum TaxID=418708 RepID=A0ABU0HX98_9HYPH|nr:type VI secretion system baseplate subunit TssG [Methylobacterium aerolatum]MDQ0446955.1 type VI secretion system protein ImpH [Methylobacterium aerolatum]
MEAATGHRAPTLNGAPIPEAGAVQFHELCLWLERICPQPGGIGGTVSPRRETVRFRANPSLSFPAEEIAAILPPEEAGAPITVVANLFGLHGPSSPLPPALTERVILAEDSNALRDFLDLFNHRLLSLLFIIWKYYRHGYRYSPGATDAISRAVAALFGMETPDRRTARPLLLPYAGLLSLSHRSATVLGSIVGDFFDVPCAIEEFVLREIRIPQEALWLLGSASSVLGRETVAGETMKDVTGKFGVRFGPLDAERCDRLLPPEQDYQSLIELINLAIRDPLDWDLGFVLSPGEARPLILGQNRLGWASWLGDSPQTSQQFVIQL